MSGTDWQQWVLGAGAITLALAGIALLAWSLFWDRSRGRKRCPRCWYDMSGSAGLVCPECGRDARRTNRMYKTRRRRRWAVVAVVLLVGAYGTHLGAVVRRDGWWAASPRWMVIVAWPHLDDWGVSPYRRRWYPGLQPEVERLLLKSEWELAELTMVERWLLDASIMRALRAENSATRRQGARLLVLLREDAVDAAPASAKGAVVMAKAAMTYARCRTYRDRGEARGASQAVSFVTGFERGVGLRREEREENLHWVLWASEDIVRVWNSRLAAPLVAGDKSNGMTALSSGRPRVWSPLVLLLPEEFAWSPSPALLFGPELAGMEQIDAAGPACYRVEGIDSGRRPLAMWIDPTRWVVMKVRGEGYELVLHPEVDVDIDQAWFDFIPANAPDSLLLKE